MSIKEIEMTRKRRRTIKVWHKNCCPPRAILQLRDPTTNDIEFDVAVRFHSFPEERKKRPKMRRGKRKQIIKSDKSYGWQTRFQDLHSAVKRVKPTFVSYWSLWKVVSSLDRRESWKILKTHSWTWSFNSLKTLSSSRRQHHTTLTSQQQLHIEQRKW